MVRRRNSHLTSAKMFALRRNHYDKMRIERIEGIKERAWYQYQALLENMPRGQGLEDDDYEPLSDDEEDFKDMVGTKALYRNILVETGICLAHLPRRRQIPTRRKLAHLSRPNRRSVEAVRTVKVSKVLRTKGRRQRMRSL